MQVTAIVATGVKNGTIDRMCQKVLEGAKNNRHSTNTVYLNDYNIAPCRGCFECLGDSNCVIKDDFHKVYDKCVKSDVLVVGSPIYFGNISGLMKNFLDRHNGNAMFNPPEMGKLRDMPKKERMSLFFNKLSKEYQPKKEIQGKKVIQVITANKPKFLLRLKGELNTTTKAFSYYIKELNNKLQGSIIYGGSLMYPEKEGKILKKAYDMGSKL